MGNAVTEMLTNPTLLLALCVSLAVFATIYTVAMPFFEGDTLKRRMKAVSNEREQIRARERARLNSETSRTRLRTENNTSVRQVVEKLNLRKLLVDDNTISRLKMAGYRSQNALNTFLFARFCLPFFFLVVAVVYIFVLDVLPDSELTTRLLAVIAATAAGFYLPSLMIANQIGKRQASIRRAWPDALDLLLICVESGVSMEQGLRRVAEEIAEQSAPLAEELVLTTAELSFLQDRRTALDNLALRTGIEDVRAVVQALMQADRFGTPIAQALRVLAQESRDQRMNAAEKKAAALPPKLTVPMIVFFLPVLIAVILGPAILQVMDTF
ncbi:type II secretion system protein [Xaviernesmea oryzae]|uniref:Type II secretion system protein n=1 Tax=Xaviernesmea oryzae TaxID=464029 RepID=A0A1Q9B2N2_9HYPH|nr:type II secretion system F family protein [Xaviernesmea oryzae]OLP62266.1 type II secretion system protein [Xaviernesmea oryzae]SEL93871.1 tight adherence protein C [Xaviernesmea oryzae]